jgi:hypothetical protein
MNGRRLIAPQLQTGDRNNFCATPGSVIRRACLQAWPIGHRLKEVRTIKDVAENQKSAPAATRAIDGTF